MQQTSLLERRAEFVYNACRLAAIAADAPVIPAPYAERESAFQLQFLSVISDQCGPDRCMSAKEAHDRWVQAYIMMGWVYGATYDRVKKTHPDMVPYDQLGRLERDKDDVYLAMCDIARLWIRA